MYAIVDIAGQQFKVEAGMEIFVNRLAAEKGAAVEFDKVLLIDEDGAVKVGAPYVDGAKVTATVLDDTCKGKKVLVFKKKRRKGYQKCNGHRQYLTKLQINAIAELIEEEQNMAHKKGVGSSKNGRESHSKRLGIKKFGDQTVKAGNILVRQRGTVHNPGLNVGMGKDHTLYALIDGKVSFRRKADNKSYVSVVPFEN